MSGEVVRFPTRRDRQRSVRVFSVLWQSPRRPRGRGAASRDEPGSKRARSRRNVSATSCVDPSEELTWLMREGWRV